MMHFPVFYRSSRLHLLVLSVLSMLMLCLSVGAEDAFDGYIVRFKDEQSAAKALALMEASPMLYSEDEEPDNCTPIYEKCAMYKTDSAEWVALFEELGLVNYSEPDYYAELYDYAYDAEPEFSKQWAHTLTGVRAVWELGIYGNDVKVAVIDSGVDVTHPDLKDNLLPGQNYVAAADGTVDPNDLTDSAGHGTGVAGVIAAAVNGEGLVGVAHRAKIVPLRVAGTKTFSNSKIAAAVFDAVFTYDVDVINLSLGYKTATDDASLAVREAIDAAVERNVIVVAAAGNSSSDAYSYPASYDNVVSVANVAKTADGYVYSSSSQYNDQVTIAAPGTSVRICKTGGLYVTSSGTSFSSPYVAGVAALAKAIDPELTVAEFMQLLKETSERSKLAEAEVRNDHYGYGLIDAQKLLCTLATQNGNNCFISPIDVRNGSAFVHIGNLTKTNGTYSFTAQSLYSGRPESTVSALQVLEAGKGFEVDITKSYTAEKGKLYMLLRCDETKKLAKVVTEPYTYGDVNGDGDINVKDNMILARYLAGWDNTELLLPAADYDSDGKVNVKDNMILARHLAGWEGYTTLPLPVTKESTEETDTAA